jgi:hypothetical protein
MDNPLKKRLLATLCTRGLKKSLCGWVVEGGQGKRGTMDSEEQADLAAKGGERRLVLPFNHASGAA